LQPTGTCERVLLGAWLKIQLLPNGTAIEACHADEHSMRAPRIYATVKVNTRTDRAALVVASDS
jgi:uncharacterized protein YqgV (UPF0045/DUF77 family)